MKSLRGEEARQFLQFKRELYKLHTLRSGSLASFSSDLAIHDSDLGALQKSHKEFTAAENKIGQYEALITSTKLAGNIYRKKEGSQGLAGSRAAQLLLGNVLVGPLLAVKLGLSSVFPAVGIAASAFYYASQFETHVGVEDMYFVRSKDAETEGELVVGEDGNVQVEVILSSNEVYRCSINDLSSAFFQDIEAPAGEELERQVVTLRNA